MYHYNVNEKGQIKDGFNNNVGQLGAGNKILDNYGHSTGKYISGPTVFDSYHNVVGTARQTVSEIKMPTHPTSLY